MNNENFQEIHEKTKIELSFLTDKIITKKQLSKMHPYIFDKIHFKSYPRFEIIKLPKKYKKSKKLYDAIDFRYSFREFSKKYIGLQDLSDILRFSCGINRIEEKDYNKSRRVCPSGGARYPLEIYTIINYVKDLKKGVYHYNIKAHGLEFLWKVTQKTLKNIFGEKWILRSSCIFVITGVFDRTTIKYGNRGYRYILFEAGHTAQNILLVSTSLNINSCCIGGFIDDILDNLLDISGTSEHSLYCVAIGK